MYTTDMVIRTNVKTFYTTKIRIIYDVMYTYELYIYLKLQRRRYIRDIKLFIPRENRMCMFFHRFQYTLNGHTQHSTEHCIPYAFTYTRCMSFTTYIYIYFPCYTHTYANVTLYTRM